MKCITQMPVVAIATVARTSQRALAAPWEALLRVAHRRPRKQPTHDIT